MLKPIKRNGVAAQPPTLWAPASERFDGIRDAIKVALGSSSSPRGFNELLYCLPMMRTGYLVTRSELRNHLEYMISEGVIRRVTYHLCFTGYELIKEDRPH